MPDIALPTNGGVIMLTLAVIMITLAFAALVRDARGES